MLSIQPKWCELIASGKKTVEVRKTRPKIDTPFNCYIYCTKQKVNGEILLTYDKKVEGRNRGFRDEGDIALAGKVIGEFVCNYIEDFKEFEYGIDALHRHIKLNACINYDEIYQYLGFEKCGYGWNISNLVIYDKPKELSEFKHWKKFDWWDYGHHKNKPQWELRSLSRPPQSWCYVEEGAK